MPIMYMRDPLCCIISGGPGSLTLAVMAAPCELRQPAAKLGPGAAGLLQRLRRAHTARELVGEPWTKCADNRVREQIAVLESHGLLERVAGTWKAGAAGHQWLAAPGGRTVDRSPKASRVCP